MDVAAVTARQQAMWATGDFHRIGVAAGAGSTALAVARRWVTVTATDYVPIC